MTLVPRLLSNSIRKELVLETNETEETLFKKLKINPRLLVRFFKQATQNRTWCANHLPLMRRLLTCIYDKVIGKEIPFDYALRSCTYLFKCNQEFLNLVCFNPETRSFSGLVLLNGIPSLLPSLQNKEFKEKNPLAPFIGVKHFKILYTTFYTGDFSPFTALSNVELQACLMQSIQWKYTLGVIEIQKAYLTRIVNVVEAFEALGFAVLNKLPLLKCYCEKIISNYDFEIHFQNQTKMLVALKACIEIPPQSLASLADKAKFEHSLEMLNRYVPDAHYKKLDLTFVTDEALILSLRKINASQFLNHLNDVCRSKEKLNPVKITTIVSDGGTMISNDFLLGFCSLCPSMNMLILRRYNQFHDKFFLNLSLVVPKLRKLIIEECCYIDKQTLKALSDAFPSLEELTVDHIFRLESLDCLNLPHLKLFRIERCPLIKSTDLKNNFAHICTLSLGYTKWSHVKTLALSSSNVQFLSVRSVADFRLEDYPYPESIKELLIDSETLALSVVDSSLPCLESFVKLESITLVGSVNDLLNNALNTLNNRIKLKFVNINIDDKQ